MNAWSAFREGFRRGLGYWQIPVVFYLASLLSALPFLILPGINLYSAASQTAIQQAAEGIEAWLCIDALMTNFARMVLGESAPPFAEFSQSLSTAYLFGVLAVLSAPVLIWVISASLHGGALTIYKDNPQPFRCRRFLRGCWRWLGAFLLLGLLQMILGLVIFIPVGVIALLAISFQFWLIWIILPLLIVFAVIWIALFDITQMYLVIGDNHHLWRALGSAIRFTVRRPLRLGGLYFLALSLLALLHIVFRLGVFSHLPLAWWPISIIAQQGFIFLRLWAKSIRMAGGLVLIQN